MLAGHQYEQAAPAGEGGWPQQPGNWPSADGRAGAGATGPIGNGAAANPASGYPAARAGGHGGTNHTMIVPAGMGGDSDAGAFNGGGFNGTDYGGGAYSGRRQHRHDEPWLQRWLFSRRILILLAVVLVGLGAWWLTEGQYFSVPSVVGMSVATARGDLTNAGLVAVSGTARHSDAVPAGQVISTDPAPGARITHGGKVTLITSLGPVLITVPSVSGQQLAQAEQSLRAAGLRPGQATYQASASIPSGVVISTSPVAYTHWPQNKPVGLIVSEGPPLPGFAGQQLSAAQGAAATGGYSINPVTVAKSDQPAGTILRQSPAAGTPITAGEVVTVWVSPGPPQVAVPNVQGMNVNQAEKALTAAGFQVTVNQIGIGNRVVSYSPTGQAPQGSTITLTVGFGF
jgi:serine/threonine-protein kinase